MITFHIITAFPSFFESPLSIGLMSKAISKGIISFEFLDLKNFGDILDDRPYGGGQGMVLKIEPIVRAIREVKPKGEKIIKILMTPSGKLLNQSIAEELAKYTDIVIICGRYEGVDARISNYIDEEISIGDYVIHSGETAALVLIEAVARLQEGFKSKECTEEISLGLLGFPQYTRPQEFEGLKVPEILLSGNHREIRRFRIKKSVEKTMELRPDLIEKIVKKIIKEIEESQEVKKKEEKLKILREFIEGKGNREEIQKILVEYFENLSIQPDPFL